jgi:membrane-associated phospholipid phosphatase
LLPSLHIALRTILAELYARHTRGLLRAASNIWFVLIGLSAVLTYQHHVMDVVAGFGLGAYCLYFFPESSERLPVIPNRRVGSYYLVGAFILAALIFFFCPWGAFLIWPAVSLVIMAAAYFQFGPGVFRKRNGCLPWTTWWTLGPVLLGQEISRLYYRRQCHAWDELTPHVWIGGVLSRNEARTIVQRGVTAVLDLTAEFSDAARLRNVAYQNIPILDLTAPTSAQLQEMVSFIEHESETGIVYIHCKIGYSRTAAVAAAYLVRSGLATSVSEAIAELRRVRPCVVMRPEMIEALNRFATDSPSFRAKRSEVEETRVSAG